MRVEIDLEDKRIIVPDSYFNYIDKKNKVLEEQGIDKKIEYTQYIKDAFELSIKNAILRKSDLKRK